MKHLYRLFLALYAAALWFAIGRPKPRRYGDTKTALERADAFLIQWRTIWNFRRWHKAGRSFEAFLPRPDEARAAQLDAAMRGDEA